MAQFDITIRCATDLKSEWEKWNRTLHVGELAFATENGKVVEVKLGLGALYIDTPTILHPFYGLITSYGRDLDVPGSRNKSWNITTVPQAIKEILAPYSPPSIAITSPSSFPTQEVGATYTSTNQAFNVAIGNSIGMLTEGNPLQKRLYVDNNPQVLADQTSQAVNVAVTKSISANSTTPGAVEVIKAGVKRSDNSSFVEVTKSVVFQLRSGYFLWPENDDLMAKTDAQITAIIQGLGADVAGRQLSTLNYNGGKGFGTVAFNSALAGSGKYNIYTFYPASAGTQSIAPDAFRTSPVGTNHRTFNYTNGNATIGYKFTKMVDFIVGSYDAYMV